MLSLFTFGDKEVSEAEFQDKSDRPKQATPRHKLLQKVNVLLTNSDHQPFGTLGAHLGKKIESTCAAFLGNCAYFEAWVIPDPTALLNEAETIISLTPLGRAWARRWNLHACQSHQILRGRLYFLNQGSLRLNFKKKRLSKTGHPKTQVIM